MRRHLACLALLVSACTEPNAPAGEPDGASADAPPPADAAAEPVEERAFQWLLGRFDSRRQAEVDPAYFAIEVRTCRVSAPELGERVLYLEQSRVGMAPYRQRIYVVGAEGQAGTDAVSVVYELVDPSRHVGLCEDSPEASFAPEDVTERVGCAVHLRAEGDRFVGGTSERQCPSTLMGATYATSEVELRADGFTSWDRGYDDAGRQVWGATEGPYQFVRQAP